MFIYIHTYVFLCCCKGSRNWDFEVLTLSPLSQSCVWMTGSFVVAMVAVDAPRYSLSKSLIDFRPMVLLFFPWPRFRRNPVLLSLLPYSLWTIWSLPSLNAVVLFPTWFVTVVRNHSLRCSVTFAWLTFRFTKLPFRWRCWTPLTSFKPP